MPEENVNTPAASTATPDASPLPDSMNQPGAAAPVMESVAPANLTEANAPAYGEPGAAAQPSTVVPVGQPVAQLAKPGKHAVLASMVQSLSDALAGASAGLASKGKVSGAAVVQELESQRQQAKQSATAAAQAQKNADLQNQLTTGQINETNVKNHILGQTWNDTVNQSHFAAQEAGLGLQQKAQEIFDTTGRVPTGWSADPNTGQLTQGAPANNAAAVGTNPPTTAAPAGQPSAPSMYDRRAGIILDAVGKELADPAGKDDPSVTAARQLFAPGSTATIEQKQQALISLQAKAGMNAQVIKNLTEKADLAAKQETVATSAPFGAKADGLNAAMLDRYKVLNPGATALPAGLAMTADSTPKDFDRADKILQQTENAQATKAQRDTINQMRAQTLKLTQGTTGTGDTTKTGKDYLATLNPSRASVVQTFGEGRAQVNSRSFSNPAGQSLLADITAAYPDYDQSKAITWDKTRNEYTGSGATAKKAVSYNTALEHMQDLYNNSTKEGLYLPGSKAYSDRSVALGYVSNEVGNAIKTGVMSKDEGEHILDSLKGWTPSTAKERVAETARLLYDKIEEYQTKFADAAPSSAVKVPTLISPKAQAAYNFVQGINQVPAATTSAAPAGATGKAYPKGQTSGPQYWHDTNGKNLGLVQ